MVAHCLHGQLDRVVPLGEIEPLPVRPPIRVVVDPVPAPPGAFGRIALPEAADSEVEVHAGLIAEVRSGRVLSINISAG